MELGELFEDAILFTHIYVFIRVTMLARCWKTFSKRQLSDVYWESQLGTFYQPRLCEVGLLAVEVVSRGCVRLGPVGSCCLLLLLPVYLRLQNQCSASCQLLLPGAMVDR